MKKKKIIIRVVILLVFAIICISRIVYVDLHRVYREWQKELNIKKRDGLDFDWMKLSDDGIDVYITLENTHDGYESLNEIVNTHNKFVEQKPDYFPDNYEISFVVQRPSGKSYMIFSNVPPLENDVTKIDGLKMGYCSANIYEILDDFSYSDAMFEVPVLVLTDGNAGTLVKQSYSVVQQMKGLEKVVLDYSYYHGEYSEAYEAIQEYAPGVEVYLKSGYEYVKMPN
ncbi:hypothetical protein SAMN02910275_01484 [Butyrivibrio sp. INlla18]|uniref:hypothetical protein n=1 Tax=Butyrivibrio sp. INlla18 TaxID=1520806 RepID=UPI0008881357|nr:hypothetical protein [Butyrivibrio sp. INlla18]SDA60277.1 hypothetical protein SAMN02910275_01484 [Butyrivibrio sp. INlla18]